MRVDEIKWEKAVYYNSSKVYHKEYGPVTLYKDLSHRYPGPYCIHIHTNNMKYFDNITDFAFHVALCEPLEGNNEDE